MKTITLFAMSTMALPLAAHAERYKIDIGGYIDAHSSGWNDSIFPAARFSGFYYIDTEFTPLASTSPGAIGGERAIYNNSTFGSFLRIGSYTYSFGGTTKLYMWNNWPDILRYTVSGPVYDGSIDGFSVDVMNGFLDDTSLYGATGFLWMLSKYEIQDGVSLPPAEWPITFYNEGNRFELIAYTHPSKLSQYSVSLSGVITRYEVSPMSIPEPASFAALTGMACLGGVMLRRRRRG